VRAHFTSLINKEKNLFLNRSQQNNLQSDCAIIKAIKAMMIKINSKMKEWDTSDNSAERSAFECSVQFAKMKTRRGYLIFNSKDSSLWLFLSWHRIIFEYYSLLKVSWDLISTGHEGWSAHTDLQQLSDWDFLWCLSFLCWCSHWASAESLKLCT
jgi:hypothetical protein